MEKLSMEQIRELVAEAPGMIRKLASERDFYKNRFEELQRHEEAEKVASEMHRKGINTEMDLESLTASLEKAAEQGKLETIRTAVDYVGPDMGSKLAQLTGDEQRIAAGSSDFERFLLSSGVG
jgi:predicted RNA-binding protein with EMAP domain